MTERLRHSRLGGAPDIGCERSSASLMLQDLPPLPLPFRWEGFEDSAELF
jgi:hypothetical protein